MLRSQKIAGFRNKSCESRERTPMKSKLASHNSGECLKSGVEGLCVDCEWYKYRLEGGRPLGKDAFILFLKSARAPEIRKLYAWLFEQDQAIPIGATSFVTMLRGIGFTRLKGSTSMKKWNAELVFKDRYYYFGQGESFIEAYEQAFGFFIKDMCGTLPAHLRQRGAFEVEE